MTGEQTNTEPVSEYEELSAAARRLQSAALGDDAAAPDDASGAPEANKANETEPTRGDKPAVSGRGAKNGNDKLRAKSAARRLQDAVQAEADAASEREAPAESDNGQGDDGRAAKLAQLQGLAQELGLSIEGNTVTPIERAKFRERRRQTLDSLKQKENELAERERALSSSLEALRAANTALESGDFDALARALGRSNWNELNADAIRHFQDPNFRRLRELERQVQEREEREARARQEAERQQQERQRQQAVEQYKSNLIAQMRASKHATVATLAEDPVFLETILEVQRANWDGRRVPSPEEIVELPGFRQRLEQSMERADQVRRRLARALGRELRDDDDGSGDAHDARRSTGSSARSTSRTSIPARKATEASPPRKLSDSEFLQYAQKRMFAAARDEEEARERRNETR